MTSFIVISTTESLNRFVDDIAACRPQNPVVANCTHIGTGKLILKNDGLYYHYTYGNVMADNPSEKTLCHLLANQIANFRLQSNLGSNVLQIFLLENPITEEDYKRAELVFDSLQKVISEKRYENNCHIVRVVFSYDVNSLDVTTQVNDEYLSHILNNETNTQTDISPHVLYIDNQDRNGAALTSTKEEHDLLIPRMLCDFMMLYSSENNSYNVRNVSHNSITLVFSIGYAECMYYFKDIERYYQLAYNHDIRKYYLNCPNDKDNRELDYGESPLGLIERRDLLSPRYVDVPYSENISKYAESVDKEIDDIVRLQKQSIIDIKAHALEEARSKDEEETEALRQTAVDNGEDPETIGLITKNTDDVNARYPDYIERNDLYKLWLVKHTDANEHFEEIPTCNAARVKYEQLIKFIQLEEFKQFIINPPVKGTDESSTETPATTKPTENKGCNIFARLFRRVTSQPIEYQVEEPNKEENAEIIIKVIASIATLLKEKAQYKKLCNYIEQVNDDIKFCQKQMDDFRLTTHSKCVDNLINLKVLKEFQTERSQQHIDTIIQNWRNIKHGTLNDLLKEANNECAADVAQYRFINWEYPFVFVNKDIDIKNIAIELHKRATPFIQTYTTRAIKENLTSYIYYHDREYWKQQIDDLKTIKMPLGTTTELSTHIESKFCMFQILQMDKEIIDGLTDLHTFDSRN